MKISQIEKDINYVICYYSTDIFVVRVYHGWWGGITEIDIENLTKKYAYDCIDSNFKDIKNFYMMLYKDYENRTR